MAEKAAKWLSMFVHVVKRERHRRVFPPMTALVPHVPAGIVDKLAKVAGILGLQPRQGKEVAAAAHRATCMLREAGLTWRQVIEAAGPRTPERALLGLQPRLTGTSHVQTCLSPCRPHQLGDQLPSLALRPWVKVAAQPQAGGGTRAHRRQV